jgi:methionyl-tRNA formyltransferase
LSIICGKNKKIKQDNSNATCNVSFTNNMRYIDWNQSAEHILNHIRAFSHPYAGSIAVTTKGTQIIIHKATYLDINRGSPGPGSYIQENEKIIVQTHTTPIVLEDFICDKNITKGRFVSGVPDLNI